MSSYKPLLVAFIRLPKVGTSWVTTKLLNRKFRLNYEGAYPLLLCVIGGDLAVTQF